MSGGEQRGGGNTVHQGWRGIPILIFLGLGMPSLQYTRDRIPEHCLFFSSDHFFPSLSVIPPPLSKFSAPPSAGVSVATTSVHERTEAHFAQIHASLSAH